MAYQVVLLVGAQRSGTTWLQRMLGAHPGIATTQETGLWDEYMAPLVSRWEWQLSRGPDNRYKGLPAILTPEELREVVRGAATTSVYDKVAGLKPGVAAVLDKCPDYSPYTSFIHRMLPEAKFVHIVRDGRDVASSLVAASRGWGRSWAPSTVEYAAQRWMRYVEGVRGAELPAEGYLELRYEDLLVCGPAELRRCLEFCGVSAEESLCADIYDNFTFDHSTATASPSARTPDPLLWSGEVLARGASQPTEPPGFFRVGRPGTWRDDWSAFDCWSFDRLAGELLVSLGYERDRSWARTKAPVAAAFATSRIARRKWRRARGILASERMSTLRAGNALMLVTDFADRLPIRVADASDRRGTRATESTHGTREPGARA